MHCIFLPGSQKSLQEKCLAYFCPVSDKSLRKAQSQLRPSTSETCLKNASVSRLWLLLELSLSVAGRSRWGVCLDSRR